MCTAITYHAKDHYFGRNLDLEYHYREAVVVTPRYFPFHFRCESPMNSHYAFLGVATIAAGYPLYYDATNEYGLSIAGLNFPGNAAYYPITEHKNNIAPFELIPWVLGQCKAVSDAKQLLVKTNIARIDFSKTFPVSPLHWIIADPTSSITVETTTDGMHIYDNPVGVLTNNPPFPFHMHNLSNYIHLTREEPVNRFAPKLNITPYSRGMGAIGLPGDLSSASRFIRAAFVKLNSVSDPDEASCVSQFFHILGAVAQQKGCVKIENGYEKTVYTSCCNVSKGIYYYTTYDNNQITAINMFHEELASDKLVTYPLIQTQQIHWEN